MKDQDIISSILSGGRARESSVDYLLNKHLGFIGSMRKKTGNDKEEDLVDAYTDALMMVVDHIISGRFKGESKISTYLYSIFYNKCRDLKKKKSTYYAEIEEWMVAKNWPQSDVLKELVTIEEANILYGVMDEMGEPCKSILMDWGYWGYTMKEIAQRTGLETAEQAKKKKYKCLQKLLKFVKRT